MSEKIVKASQFDQHPFWFNSINFILKPFNHAKIDGEKLVKKARHKTGLQNFSDEVWREPYEVLIKSINKEANLHPIGQFIMKERLTNILSNRLLTDFWLEKHPEILEQELYPVWLIAGLQRTGTTKLQRLLNSDPDNRVLLSWEAINPAPPVNQKKSDQRIKAAKLSENALKIISPGYFAIHPIEHLQPEEDVLLLDLTFLSTAAEATMHVPTYAEYIEQADHSYAYEYMTKVLKFLQWQRPAKRWILKSPHHLEFLQEAKNHFKNLQVIWPHRDVRETLPSFLSMVAYSRALFSDHVKMIDVTNHWKRKTQRMLQQAISFRMSQNTVGFTDILYNNLINDSISELKKLYIQSGKDFSDQLVQLFLQTEKTNTRGKYGKHEYQLSDFGLNDNAIISGYSFYYDFVENNLNTKLS